MNRNFLRKISGLSLLMIIMSCATMITVHAYDRCDWEATAAELYGEEVLIFLENQDRAMDFAAYMVDDLPQGRYGLTMYPSYYGGSFIDAYGNLVVNIVYNDIAAEFARGFTSIAGNSNLSELVNRGEVQTQFVDFPFNDLMDAKFFLVDFLSDNPAHPLNAYLLAGGIDNTINRVWVGLRVYNEVTIAKLADIVEHKLPMFVVREQEHEFRTLQKIIEADDMPPFRPYEPQHQRSGISPASIPIVNPGQRIFVRNNSGGLIGASMGYRSTRNGVQGFTTSLHGNAGVNDRVYVLGSDGFLHFIGNVVIDHAGGTSDSAWISRRTDVNVLLTAVLREVPFTQHLPSAVHQSQIRQGMLVRRLGGTTGPSTGSVIDATALIRHPNGQILTQQVIANSVPHSPDFGDSGGIVYVFSGPETNRAAGIHIGALGPNTMVFSKAYHINARNNLRIW